MIRIALLLASLSLLIAPPAARAATIAYELVILLQPSDELLISSGGPSFDDATFSPGGVVAATGFAFSHTFSLDPLATFSFGGCTSLDGHLNGAGTEVVALSGTCNEDDGASEGILTFFSDNTATVELPAALILLNATYTLVPEPSAAPLLAVGGVFAWALRRRA